MKGYKAFEKDFSCRGFQYEVGKTYEIEEEIKLCKTGFHFCKKIAGCFTYYPQADARFAEVEAYGEVIESDDDSKCVTDKVRIVREIPRREAVDMSNTGDWNTGNRNTGDWNTGDWNTGNWNTGNRNTGHRNTGNWNTGDWNTGNWNTGDWNVADGSSGCFCTEEPKIKLFDKDTDMTLLDWRESKAYYILSKMPMAIQKVEWVTESDMTAEEKEKYPTHETTGGFLKIIDRNDNRQEWWDELSEANKETIMSIPNFDADKFRQCTGIWVGSERR